PQDAHRTGKRPRPHEQPAEREHDAQNPQSNLQISVVHIFPDGGLLKEMSYAIDDVTQDQYRDENSRHANYFHTVRLQKNT
ncbi:hypothetical protein, partial [Klebsiella pneumoniae]|uniref:hypothetical protein n=1 Tax=Klebsiella pneumoniae TaxID=573 RepID=UPI001E3BD56A